MPHRFARAAALILGFALPHLYAQEHLPLDDSSPRVTPVVKLVDQCLPSVVAITAIQPIEPGKFKVNAGSGSVIDRAGYILTNNHVVRGSRQGHVTFHDGKSYPFKIAALFPTEDLALIKIQADRPLAPLPLGRSHDLLLGEPVLVIGTPGGLAHTISTGIVSGLHRATSTQDAFLPWVIQTTAATSGGSSGGPVINALGQQIGVVASRKADAENINFAIAADRIRSVLPHVLAAEQRYGFWLGVEVDMLKSPCTVTAVVADSPAAKAGVQSGDVIRCMDATPIRHGVDFHLALISRKSGEHLSLVLKRQDEELETEVVLGELSLAAPADEPEHAAAGLEFAAYKGRWQTVPDFDHLTPESTGVAEKPSLSVDSGAKDGFGLLFSGYVRVPSDGLYAFYTRSDDGSLLYLDDKLLVNNDGTHPAAESVGIVRLKAGLHPIRIAYFESGGSEALGVGWEGPGLGKQEIPAEAYFHNPPQEAEPAATPEATKDSHESTSESSAAG